MPQPSNAAPMAVKDAKPLDPEQEKVRMKALEGLTDLFQSEGEQGVRFILKELFQNNNIKKISDLAIDEINTVDRAYTFLDILDGISLKGSSALLKKFYDELLELRVSKSRNGRVEFITGFHAEHDQVMREKMAMGSKVK